MNLKLIKIEEIDLPQFEHDMQEAFQLGAMEADYEGDTETQILPKEDIEHSLNTKGAVAYQAVDDNGNMLGGAIVVIDEESGCNHLDFLYVKHGVQSKGIGEFIWFELEKLYPDTKVWKTCTPYFEKRNIHFYVNICRFHVVEYYNAFHPDPNHPEDTDDTDDEWDGMFEFEKKMK